MNLKNIQKKLVGSKDERAVSPVIGVILMVAITVILAAVIAAFVLDLGDSVDQEAQAGVDISQDADAEEVDVSLTSTGNVEYIVLRGDATDDDIADQIQTPAEDNVDPDDYEPAEEPDHRLNQTGEVVTVEMDDDEEGSISVVGVTEGGSETVLVEEDFDFSS